LIHKNQELYIMAKENTNIEKALDNDERIELFFNRHWKKVVAGAVAVIVIAVAVYAVFYLKEQRTKDATMALASADIKDIPALLAENPDVPGAGFAHLRLACQLMNEKKYDEAATHFLAFADDPASPVELTVNARFSAAACKENAGKQQEALNIYLAMFNDPGLTPALHNQAAFQAGRIYLAKNDKAKAKEILGSVAKVQNAGTLDPAAVAAAQWQMACQLLLDSIE
jgi:TolA-binding protein